MSARESVADVVLLLLCESFDQQGDTIESALLVRAATEVFCDAAREDLARCRDAAAWQDLARQIESCLHAIEELDRLLGTMQEAAS